MNIKTIFGVSVNLDQIKTADSLRAAELFGHLDNPSEKENEAIAKWELPDAADVNRSPAKSSAKKSPIEKAIAEQAPAEQAPAEQAPAEQAPAE